MKTLFSALRQLFQNNTTPIADSSPVNHEPAKETPVTLAKKNRFANDDPTRCTDVYWMQYQSYEQNPPIDPEKDGKWILFSNKENIVDLWKKIQRSQDNGELGSECEVSTAKPTGKSQDGLYCIRVYTNDFSDEIDVMRVRDALFKLGIMEPLNYKARYMSYLYRSAHEVELEEEFRYTV